jgi:hypothetical protein
MPAYYIGEHTVSDFALFDDYLAKAMPLAFVSCSGSLIWQNTKS